MNKYEVMIHINKAFGISIHVIAENNELALDKVQGMIYEKDGWVQLTDSSGASHRVIGNSIHHISVFPKPLNKQGGS